MSQTGEPLSEGKFSHRTGFLGITTRQVDESDTRTHVLALRVSPNWSSFARETRDVGVGVVRDERETFDLDQYYGTTSIHEDWYRADSRWGLETHWSATYLYRRDGSTRADTQSTPTSTFRTQSSITRRHYDVTGVAQISVGRGRVRDVTAVLQALALEDRLDRLGALTHPLSDATRGQLAQLYSVRSGFQAAHDRPERAFWREVSRVLHDAGALKNEWLEGEAFGRIQEEIQPAPRFTLNNGDRVEFLSELEWIGGHRDTDNDSYLQDRIGGVVVGESFAHASSRDRSELRRARFGLGLTTARARGTTTAWQASTSALYGDGPAHSIEIVSSAGLQRLLIDRWYLGASFVHDLLSETREGKRAEPTWYVSSGAQLSYLVEDHWSVDLEASRFVSQFRGRASVPTATAPHWDRSTSLRLGLTWRPSGRFDSPTLGIHERPMPTAR